jgi:hypothetical protein
MLLYRERSSPETALAFSDDFAMGLEYFEETKPLLPVLLAAHTALESAHAEAEALVKPRRAAKRKRDLAEYWAERALDKTWTRCREADGNRAAGPVASTVFPQGLASAKAPVGRSQVAELNTLVERLRQSSDPRVQGVAEQVLGDLSSSRDALDAAETEYQQAWAAHRTAADLVDLRVEEHRRTMSSLFGQLRALFPGDTRTQDLIAPTVAAARAERPEPPAE